MKKFLNWKEEFGENSREETALINQLLDWLTENEASFIEYPADPNAKAPIKISGVRVLGNESTNEEEYFFIIPKVFNEITANYPKKMVLSILTKPVLWRRIKPKNKAQNLAFFTPHKSDFFSKDSYFYRKIGKT